jgi:hypothetical protein
VHLISIGKDGVAIQLIDGIGHAVIDGEWHNKCRFEEEVILVEDLRGVEDGAIFLAIEWPGQVALTRVQVGDAVDHGIHINDASVPARTGGTPGPWAAAGLLGAGLLRIGLLLFLLHR